jgi:hypothetical protein
MIIALQDFQIEILLKHYYSYMFVLANSYSLFSCYFKSHLLLKVNKWILGFILVVLSIY